MPRWLRCKVTHPKAGSLRLTLPRNRGPNTIFLASSITKGMRSSMAVNGSTTTEVFEVYLKQFLTPESEEGQVVVIDNLPAHKPRRVRELIEERGCQLLYLPGDSL